MYTSKGPARWVFVPILVWVGLFAACADKQSAETDSPAPAASTAQKDEAWTEELIRHREENDEYFRTSRTSPMAGSQYLKSEPSNRVYLTREDRTFALADTEGPAAELLVEMKEAGWVWQQLGQEVGCEIDGEQVDSGSALEGSAIFSIGDFTIRFHPAEDHVTFIVFDPERTEMTSFEHLLYFPPDRTFAVPARLVEMPEPEAIEMPTTRNLIKTFYRYAKVQFEVDGQQQELTALKYALTGDDSSGLFIPFKDATTGQETYGAGRYLQVDDPESEDFVLDFNRAFNPLCNYSPAYNCTLPPYENHLEVAIRAGELAYPH